MNTSPKFSYGFRAEYIIAVTQGDLGASGASEMILDDGRVVKPEVVTNFAEVMRAEKRKREGGTGDEPPTHRSRSESPSQ